MSSGNIPKIKLRNSLTECGQSIRKENAGKYQNYAIKDCIVSIAATKIKEGCSPTRLSWRLVGIRLTSQIAVNRPSQDMQD